MNSVIVWVLVIKLSGAYCMETPAIEFGTEKECEVARSGITTKHALYATCEPRKKKL